MNKKTILEKLYRCLSYVDLEETMQMDPVLDADMKNAGTTDTPVFRSLFEDGYSAIDLTRNPGAYAMELLLEVYAYKSDHNEENTQLILSLMLNRDLSPVEEEIAADVTALCNSKDQDVKDIIKGVLSKARWDDYNLLPAQVCLFLMRGVDEDVREFWEDLASCMPEEPNVVSIIEKHTEKEDRL